MVSGPENFHNWQVPIQRAELGDLTRSIPGKKQVAAEMRNRQPYPIHSTAAGFILKMRKEGETIENIGVILQWLEILPLGLEEALLAGDILARLHAKGRPIDVEDGLIGATALLKGLTVVTNNIKHFRQIPNLKVEDWLQ